MLGRPSTRLLVTALLASATVTMALPASDSGFETDLITRAAGPLTFGADIVPALVTRAELEHGPLRVLEKREAEPGLLPTSLLTKGAEAAKGAISKLSSAFKRPSAASSKLSQTSHNASPSSHTGGPTTHGSEGTQHNADPAGAACSKGSKCDKCASKGKQKRGLEGHLWKRSCGAITGFLSNPWTSLGITGLSTAAYMYPSDKNSQKQNPNANSQTQPQPQQTGKKVKRAVDEVYPAAVAVVEKKIKRSIEDVDPEITVALLKRVIEPHLSRRGLDVASWVE